LFFFGIETFLKKDSSMTFDKPMRFFCGFFLKLAQSFDWSENFFIFIEVIFVGSVFLGLK